MSSENQNTQAPPHSPYLGQTLEEKSDQHQTLIDSSRSPRAERTARLPLASARQTDPDDTVQDEQIDEDDAPMTMPVSMAQINQLEADKARMLALDPNRLQASEQEQPTVMLEHAQNPNRERHHLRTKEIEAHVEQKGKALSGASHTYTKKTPRHEVDEASIEAKRDHDAKDMHEEPPPEPRQEPQVVAQAPRAVDAHSSAPQHSTTPTIEPRRLKPEVRLALIVFGLVVVALVVFGILWSI